MKNNFKYTSNYRAVLTAFVSFILGTLCLVLFKTSSDSGFFAIGYFYTLLAAAANSLILLILIINTIRRLKDYQEHLKTIFVVLLNTPIVCLYLELL